MRKLVLAGLFILLTAAFEGQNSECVKDCPAPEILPVISQLNPALGWSVVATGTEADPLAAFGRIPLAEPAYIPKEGMYMDDSRDTLHFGIDYTDTDAYLNHVPKPVYPIGPGIVTTLNPCLPCWADGENRWGKERSGAARYNFGYGAVVIIEHPYNEVVSFYTLYAHLDRIDVRMGQLVDSETQLGLMGGSGDAQNPHLHFEVRYGIPGKMWGADLTQPGVMFSWTSSRYETPHYLLNPVNHVWFTRVMENWVASSDYPR